MTLREQAAAKVNLTLEIRGKRPDGYHELESLVLFAAFGDELTCAPCGDGFALRVEGPFAEACARCGDVNLVEVTAAAFARHTGRPASGAFILTKRIPVAAGLGGGSADAAAALRILARAQNGAEVARTQSGAEVAQRPEPDIAALTPLAREIGADVPVCLLSRAAIMTGVGERLQPLAPVDPVAAVLVNPMEKLLTRDVFRELGAPALPAGSEVSFSSPLPPPKFAGFDDVLAYARVRPNHLEAPARRLLPAIGEVLATLESAPGVELVRLSGSGPTCFALFRETSVASAAAAAISRAHPGWWVCATVLR